MPKRHAMQVSNSNGINCRYLKRHATQVSNSNGIKCRCLKGNCTEHTSTYFLLRMKTPKNNLPRPQLQIRYANSHGTLIYPPTLTSIYNYREKKKSSAQVYVCAWQHTHLNSFAASNLSITCLVVELQTVGIQLQVFFLPRLQERTSQLQYLTLHNAVCWAS